MIIVAFEGPDLRLVAANAAFRAHPRLQELGIRPRISCRSFRGRIFWSISSGFMRRRAGPSQREWRIQVDIDGRECR